MKKLLMIILLLAGITYSQINPFPIRTFWKDSSGVIVPKNNKSTLYFKIADTTALHYTKLAGKQDVIPNLADTSKYLENPLTAGSYLNWGATTGATGYGLRDNGGAMEFKGSGGVWTAIPDATGSAGGFTNLSGSSKVYNTTAGNSIHIRTVAGDTTGTALSNIYGTQWGKGTIATDLASYAAEFLDANNWTSTNWTGDWASGWTHTGGNTTALSRTGGATSQRKYLVSYTISGGTGGSIVITFGGVASSTITATGSYEMRSLSTGALSVAPTTDFDKTLVLSIKLINPSNALITYEPSTSTTGLEFRPSSVVSNTFIGNNTGKYNITGSNNTGFGADALTFNNAVRNSAFGYSALKISLGAYNSAFGSLALTSNIDGVRNNAFGDESLNANTTGSDNIAVGTYSLLLNQVGSFNVAIGSNALYSNTASYNTAIGGSAMNDNTTGTYNTAVGYNSLANSNTNSNAAFGYGALNGLTTGAINTAIGGYAMYYSQSNSYCTAVGEGALYNGTSGDANTAVGVDAMYNVNGNYNTAIGNDALYNLLTAHKNVAVGFNAGRYIADGSTANTITDSSVYIGYNTKASADNVINENVFGFGATGSGSNTVTLGNASVSTIYTSAGLSVRDSLTFRTEASKIDSAIIISLATGVAGWGEVMAGDNEEWASFRFTTAGVVTLITNTTNVSTTPFNPNTLNIYDAGSGVAIQNYLSAAQKKVAINIKYFTP